MIYVDRKSYQYTKRVTNMRVQRLDIVQGKQRISGTCGLNITGTMIDRTGLELDIKNWRVKQLGNPQIADIDCIKSYVGALAQGKSEFCLIEEFREDEFFQVNLGLARCPSEGTLRQRFDNAPEQWNSILLNASFRLIKEFNPDLSTTIDGMVPLDIDSSPFDNSNTKKEGVSYTYAGYVGYHPMFAYLGKHEGYCVNMEFREGSAHPQCDKGEFIRQAICNSKKLTKNNILVRTDSAHDSIDTLKIFEEENVDFIIKRNLRQENRDKYLEMAKNSKNMQILKPRAGKTVYRAVIKADVGLQNEIFTVIEATEETIDRDGNNLLMPVLSNIDTWWTSLDKDASTLIKLYCEHATSEQYHSEIKTELDLKRLPSGKFKTNTLVLNIGIFTYNLLRLLGMKGLISGILPLRKDRKRLRIRTVIQHIIYIAAKLVSHSGKMKIVFGKHCPYFRLFKYLHSLFSPPPKPKLATSPL